MSVWTATSSVASGRAATVSVASSRKSTAEESYITRFSWDHYHF